jgi:hypothetical protein
MARANRRRPGSPDRRRPARTETRSETATRGGFGLCSTEPATAWRTPRATRCRRYCGGSSPRAHLRGSPFGRGAGAAARRAQPGRSRSSRHRYCRARSPPSSASGGARGQVRLDEARARLTQFLQVAGALVARLVEQLVTLRGSVAARAPVGSVASFFTGAQALELRQGLEPPPLLLLRQSRSRGPLGSTQTPALPGPRRARGDQPGQVGWPHTDPPLAQAVGGQAPPVDPAARAVERARSAISRRRSVASGRRARTS